jgi:hypothetical protein
MPVCAADTRSFNADHDFARLWGGGFTFGQAKVVYAM